MISYNYTIQNNKFNFVRIILLAFAIVVDFANFWIFFGGFAMLNYWRMAESIAIFLALLCVRFSTIGLITTFTYKLEDDKLLVFKKQWRNKLIADISRSDIENISVINEKYTKQRGEKIIFATTKGCATSCYMVKLKDGKKIILALDDFIFAQMSIA